jgi:Coenzyme PQQ synthesis protein D (PqqD)
VSGRAYRLREDALMAVEAGDELVALDLRSSMYLGTNASGRLLWRRLGTDATADELAALLCASYAIDPEAAARDVVVFLDELAAAGLLAGGQSGT